LNGADALAKAVADIQRQLAARPQPHNWLHEITGSLKDEPAFDDVLARGRAFRESDRPTEDAAP
jgi:hypothetical protein